jgi:hypothetical protein
MEGSLLDHGVKQPFVGPSQPQIAISPGNNVAFVIIVVLHAVSAPRVLIELLVSFGFIRLSMHLTYLAIRSNLHH